MLKKIMAKGYSFVERVMTSAGIFVYTRRRSGACFAQMPSGQLPSSDVSRPIARALVITQPKAGTYLVAEILKNLGLHHTYLHLGERKFQAYDKNALSLGLKRPRLFDVNCPVFESFKLVRQGELAVSHLEYSERLEALFSGFKLILVRRELRKSLVSYARMLRQAPNKNKLCQNPLAASVREILGKKGKSLIRQALKIYEWQKAKNAIAIKFEDMFSKPMNVVERFSTHIEFGEQTNFAKCWEESKSANTLTKGTDFISIGWTPKDEEYFRALGGPQANKILGYD